MFDTFETTFYVIHTITNNNHKITYHNIMSRLNCQTLCQDLIGKKLRLCLHHKGKKDFTMFTPYRKDSHCLNL